MMHTSVMNEGTFFGNGPLRKQNSSFLFLVWGLANRENTLRHLLSLEKKKTKQKNIEVSRHVIEALWMMLLEKKSL